MKRRATRALATRRAAPARRSRPCGRRRAWRFGRALLAVLAVAVVLLGDSRTAAAQAPGGMTSTPGGTAQTRSLDFAVAEVRYAQAEKAMERVKELYEQDLSSAAELEEAEATLRLANLELGRAYLGLVLADPQVVLHQARKYQVKGGGARVEVELVARSSFDEEAQAVESSRAASVELPVLKGVSNVVVSLKTVGSYREGILSESTIVSVPYEMRLPLLRFDEPVTIDFGLLLPDVQELLVELRYNGNVDRRQVLLGKRAGTDESLVVRSNYVTLDAELGDEAVYELQVERFGDNSAGYGFRLDGLPPEVSAQISDPDSGATFSRVFFPEGVTESRLALKLTMPNRPTALVQPDLMIPFAMFLTADADEAATGVTSAAVGGIDLQVIPRGVAELRLDVPNLYHEVVRGESVSFEVDVVNAGSLTLEQVELTVDVPLGWRAELDRALFDSLQPGGREIATLALTASGDQILGDYEGSIKVGTLAGDRLVESEPKTLRLHVITAGRPWLMAALAFAALAVFAGVVWAGVHLSRR